MRFLYSSYSVNYLRRTQLYLHPGNPECAWRSVEEPTVVRDNHRTARELQQAFSSARRVSISRSLVGSSSRACCRQPAAASPDADDRAHHREFTNAFTLINPFKVKAANVARLGISVLPIFMISSPPETSPKRFCCYPLSHGTDQPTPVYRFTQSDGAAVRLFLTGDHTNKVDLPAPFGPMIPTIAPFGSRSSGHQSAGDRRRIYAGCYFQHFIAQTRSRWNKQFVGFLRFWYSVLFSSSKRARRALPSTGGL